MKTKILLGALLLSAASLMAADGAAIYKKCVACHGPAGHMTYAGKVPPLAGKKADETIESLKGYLAGKRNQYGMGAVMSAQAKIHLKNDADIKAVAAHLQQLP